MKKKVLIIMTTSLGTTGISSMVLNYFNNFPQKEYQYQFVVWNDVDNDIKKRIKEKNGEIYKLTNRLKSPLKYLYALKKLIKENEIDIIHAHGNSSTLYIEMLAAKIAGVKVRIAHSHSSQCKYKFVHYLLKPLFRRSYTQALACSKKAGDWLFGKNYELIRNGIELEKFKFNLEIREVMRKTLKLENKKVIGIVASFVPVKNHIFLLDVIYEIIKKDKSAVLLLIGDGVLKEQLINRIEELNIKDHVIFLGNRKDVPSLLHAMDIFVLPSLYEGLPFVLVEAQASGLQCYVSDKVSEEVKLTKLVNLISLDVGSICWAETIELCRKNNRILDSNKAYESLYLKGYDISIEAQKLESLYDSLLKKTEI